MKLAREGRLKALRESRSNPSNTAPTVDEYFRRLRMESPPDDIADMPQSDEEARAELKALGYTDADMEAFGIRTKALVSVCMELRATKASLAAARAEVEALLAKWDADLLTYPVGIPEAVAAAIAVRLCRDELAAALDRSATKPAGEG